MALDWVHQVVQQNDPEFVRFLENFLLNKPCLPIAPLSPSFSVTLDLTIGDLFSLFKEEQIGNQAMKGVLGIFAGCYGQTKETLFMPPPVSPFEREWSEGRKLLEKARVMFVVVFFGTAVGSGQVRS